MGQGFITQTWSVPNEKLSVRCSGGIKEDVVLVTEESCCCCCCCCLRYEVWLTDIWSAAVGTSEWLLTAQRHCLLETQTARQRCMTTYGPYRCHNSTYIPPIFHLLSPSLMLHFKNKHPDVVLLTGKDDFTRMYSQKRTNLGFMPAEILFLGAILFTAACLNARR